MGTLLMILVVGGIIYLIVDGIKMANQWEVENSTFTGAHKGWDIYFTATNRQVLALEPNARRLAIGQIAQPIEVPWSAINSVEIEKNGQSVQRTNRGSQVMGAAVGGILLGPFGLLVGALTGSKRQQEWVNELALKVIIDHPTAPIHRIRFFHSGGKGVRPDHHSLRASAQRLEHLHALLSNAIRLDHRETFAPSAAASEIETRLSKLWDLHQSGALTEEEFLAQKRNLLNSPVASNSLPS